MLVRASSSVPFRHAAVCLESWAEDLDEHYGKCLEDPLYPLLIVFHGTKW